ncbi:glycosyltransferase family 10 [Flavobacterium amniphilum]|uniref:glycosyltransferase family 10 domain-containing protein n=1 Tax=Flavobacterium amniphilum TaxID=1834035 RepID=UPI00202A324A|nr:glycosyltransferase family 10 [Flavobacterium amniphilum]MCL9805113.1 glycosyltransferase family 10 [Flavobacterium amniphilum]
MMKTVKVNFVDFWSDFDKTNNYFYNLLIRKYNVIIEEENPDLIFFSCFGQKYLKYKCKRILYMGENRRPDLSACDFAFSYDYNSSKRHFRLPLYSLYIDHHKMLDELEIKLNRDEAEAIWKQKTKFCCMVVSNPDCKERIDFFHALSKVKQVDSGGKYLNNVGGPVESKHEFIKDYKFVLSFENGVHDGYTTEKIMEPILAKSIPIYWGNKKVSKDFNGKRFVNFNDYASQEDLINAIIEIDQNDELGIQMIMESTFSPDRLQHEEEHEKVLEHLSQVIENNKKPVAQQYWSYVHRLKIKWASYKRKHWSK